MPSYAATATALQALLQALLNATAAAAAAAAAAETAPPAGATTAAAVAQVANAARRDGVLHRCAPREACLWRGALPAHLGTFGAAATLVAEHLTALLGRRGYGQRAPPPPLNIVAENALGVARRDLARLASGAAGGNAAAAASAAMAVAHQQRRRERGLRGEPLYDRWIFSPALAPTTSSLPPELIEAAMRLPVLGAALLLPDSVWLARVRQAMQCLEAQLHLAPALEALLRAPDEQLELLLLLQFEELEVVDSQPELLLWAALDAEGEQWLEQKARGDGADAEHASDVLESLRELLAGSEGEVVSEERERLAAARDANCKLCGVDAAEAQRRLRAAVLQIILQLRRSAPAWRGVIPLVPGGRLGMDASASAAAAALESAAAADANPQKEATNGNAFVDVVHGRVRLPRLPYKGVAALRAALALQLRALCRRVTLKEESAGADMEAAAQRSGAQGVEAKRLKGGDLDEAFAVGPAGQELHKHALLFNSRLAKGAAAAAAREEQAAGGSIASMGEASAQLLDSLAWWQQLGGAAAAVVDARRAGTPMADEFLLAQLRGALGVLRLPRLAELEGYRIFDVATSEYHAEQTEGVPSGSLVLVTQGRHGALSLMIVGGRRWCGDDDWRERTILVRATL